jgi:hypothetical protein
MSDPIDRALGAYFRAELPDPWPGPPAVAEPARAAAGRWPSRAALGLSAAVLVALGLLLAGDRAAPPKASPGPGLLKEATAEGPKLPAGPMGDPMP